MRIVEVVLNEMQRAFVLAMFWGQDGCAFCASIVSGKKARWKKTKLSNSSLRIEEQLNTLSPTVSIGMLALVTKSEQVGREASSLTMSFKQELRSLFLTPQINRRL